MKAIYLYDKNYDTQKFEYENLSDLNDEFKKRGIEIIGYNSRIGYGLIIKSICFSGLKHFVSYWGYDAIQIGCKLKTISEWLELYEEIGNDEDYPKEAILEYKGYIDIIKNIHESGSMLPIENK